MKCDECNMFVRVRESGSGGWDKDKNPIPLIALNNYDMTKWICRRCHRALGDRR
jgi:hypothetical protein